MKHETPPRVSEGHRGVRTRARKYKPGKEVRAGAAWIADDLGIDKTVVLAVFHQVYNILKEGRAEYVEIEGFGRIRAILRPSRVYATKNGPRVDPAYYRVVLDIGQKVKDFFKAPKSAVRYPAPNPALLHAQWEAARKFMQARSDRIRSEKEGQ